MTPTHFTDGDWIDYVRSTGSPERDHLMAEHLAGGCPDCLDVCETWRSVVNAAAAARQYEPPAEAIRFAKAQLLVETRPGWFTRAAGTARLLFDSQLAPATVGVRNAAPPRRVRKLVYADGEYVIDLLVQQGSRRGEMVMIGQITSPDRGHAPVEGSHVLLERQTEVVARATTNGLGEFQLEFEDLVADLSLTFAFQQSGTVVKLGNVMRMPS
jgi:anti-sigma factor RsiW